MEAFERKHRLDTGSGWYVGGRVSTEVTEAATEIMVVSDAKKIGTRPQLPTEVMFEASTAALRRVNIQALTLQRKSSIG
jgi:hypothetical protein